MEILEFIIVALLLLYTIFTIIFTIGVNKIHPIIEFENLPTVSIIVAARNEENNILDCLISLDKINYPKEKIEIAIVDDNSSDKTSEIILDFIKNKNEFIYLKPSKQFENLFGKTNALANAIDKTFNEIIFTTDADCIVPTDWIKSTVSIYKKNVAVVCGFTNLKYSNLFERIQNIDLIYLLSIAAGSMNVGYPMSAIGNNMSFRRSVYEELGGYESIPFSITEDFQLVKEIGKLKKYKLLYFANHKNLVSSHSEKTLSSLFNQKRRWGIGGLSSRYYGLIVMATAIFFNITIFISLIFIPALALTILVTKVLIDFVLLLTSFKKLNMNFNIKSFLFFEFYYFIFYTIIFMSILLSKKITWKNRKY